MEVPSVTTSASRERKRPELPSGRLRSRLAGLFLRTRCRAGFQLLDDQLIEPSASVTSSDAESVLDGPVAGATVANDAHAVDAQERSAAESTVIVAMNQRLQCFLGLFSLHVER